LAAREERGSWCRHDLYIVDASQLVIAGDVRGPALAYNSGRMSDRPTGGPERLKLLRQNGRREAREQVAHDHRAWARAARAGTSINMLIAADHELVRASYRAVLDSDDLIEITAEAADSQEAVALAAAKSPDVVLLDLALPDLDSPETTAVIVSHPAFARVAVLLIVTHETDGRVLSALRAGAVGVLARDAETSELIRAVKLLARGNALFPAELVRALIAELPPQSGQHGSLPEQLDKLTGREREVLALVGTGLSNAEIAAHLIISPATARTHVSRVMVKVRARDRAQLVVLAYETGLVQARARTR
jgi:DNA-binding NarL/FixJ family response regulator